MFQLAGGSLGDQTTPVITNIGTINISGPARLNNYGNIANSGMMIQSGTGTITGGVGLINNAGAVYDIQNDNGVSLNNFNNYALIKKSAGTATSQIYSISSFYNAGGTLEADSALIDRLKHAQMITMGATSLTGQTTSLSFPLTHFAETFDGPGSTLRASGQGSNEAQRQHIETVKQLPQCDD